jgi:uncharacterized membrane protein YedE/YeeE
MEQKGSIRELFEAFFRKTWPVWVGGVLLGIGNILLFLVKSPWGGSGGYVNLGQHIYQVLGLSAFSNTTPFFQHPYAVINLLIVIGAFIASLLAREFAVRIPPVGELLKGLIGGVLMGLGATMGIGCTIGAFFSGWAALSGGALVLTVGLIIGTYLALRYLLWEMEAIPKLSSGRGISFLSGTSKKGVWQPWLGAIVLAGALILCSFKYKDNNVLTWFAVLGVLFGIILQRSRFCVVRAFREPFMTGESNASIGVMAGLLVGIFGFTVIKYMGVGAVNPADARHLALVWVYPHFWLRALIGGFIFGIGMTIAGGCAVGTLWRVGEGQIKLWVAALGFALMAPISKKFIVPGFANALPEWAKKKVFLPDTFGYGGTLIFLLVLILLWYMFVKWNERTGKFSAM